MNNLLKIITPISGQKISIITPPLTDHGFSTFTLLLLQTDLQYDKNYNHKEDLSPAGKNEQ
jgi:hypothetical protein